jgi:hypothetical protein
MEVTALQVTTEAVVVERELQDRQAPETQVVMEALERSHLSRAQALVEPAVVVVVVQAAGALEHQAVEMALSLLETQLELLTQAVVVVVAGMSMDYQVDLEL